MRELFLAGFLALPFVLFAGLTVWRKSRFARLAQELGGRWVRTGLLAPGAIEGPDFRIEAVRRGKGYGTRLSLVLRSSPGVFLLRTDFLADVGSAAHLFVQGVRSERVFCAQLRFAALVPAERAQRRTLIDWLPSQADLRRWHAELTEARVVELELDDANLATSFRGICTDAAQLRRTLGALRGLAAGRADGVRASVA